MSRHFGPSPQVLARERRGTRTVVGVGHLPGKAVHFAPSVRRSGVHALSTVDVVALQKAAGNNAVAQLMRNGRVPYTPRRPIRLWDRVQRCGATPSELCPCHDTETKNADAGHVTAQRLAEGAATPETAHPTVRWGSRGQPVFELHVKLNLEGASPPLAADSIFGPKTNHAVRVFQAGHELEQDGIVGPKTWAELDAGLPAVAQPPDCDTLLTALGQQPPGPQGTVPVAQTLQDPGVSPSSCGLIPPDLLAQLAKILGSPPAPPAPVATKCTRKTPSGDVIGAHTVSAATISAPGDTVTFTVAFKCVPAIKTVFTVLETTGGTDLGLRKAFPVTDLTLTREWNGKKLFAKVGTFMVDDGKYRHRVEEVVFAFDASGKSLKVTGANLTSPPVTVDARAKAGAQDNKANIDLLAEIIKSEMGIGNAQEEEAIGWAVRNQLLRLNTRNVKDARDFFHDATGSAPTAAEIAMAKTILSAKNMSGDTSGGAIKWFSPQSMPPRAGTCAGNDCRGGLREELNTDTGKKEKVFFPSFSTTMTHRPVTGARNWYVRFYAL